VISALVVLVIAPPLAQVQRLTVTSNVASGYCLASQYSARTKQDSIWLASRSKGGHLRTLFRLPIERYDRNLPDKLFVGEKRVVALVNANVDLYTPFFLSYRDGKWSLMQSPSFFEFCAGRGNVAQFNSYQVYALNCANENDESNHTTVVVFSAAGLKTGRVPFLVGEVKRFSANCIGFEVLHEMSDHSLQPKWKRFRWPFSAKNGYWQLEEA
jgi:hypothetical protein